MQSKPIEGFADYVVGEDGTVYNTRRNVKVRPSKTQRGATKVTLYRDGRPYTKSLALLVAQAHLWNDFDPELFNTPIHLDNDSDNNCVENLAWRPRWFAVKYSRQYWMTDYRYNKSMIQEVTTGIVYKGAMEVCQKYGVLFVDVVRSCTHNTTVFPQFKQFRFLD